MVRVVKAGSTFCYPEYIEREMTRVFGALSTEGELRGRSAVGFAEKAAHVMAELNAIHPFREGNGRTQNIFLSVLADRAGHPLDFARLNPQAMLAAVIVSFRGDEKPLRDLILQLVRRGR
jgi:cell filamentation protein